MDWVIGLLFIQFAICAIAGIFGTLSYAIVAWITRTVSQGRGRALRIALVFPIVAILYLEGGLLARNLVQYQLGRDTFLSGVYHYPLINGYEMVTFDEDPSGGHIEGSRTHESISADAVQVVGSLIFVDQGPVPSAPTTRGEVADIHSDVTVEVRADSDRGTHSSRYLVIDTRSSEIDHVSLEDLQRLSAKEGVSVKMVSAEEAFSIAASAASPGAIFLGLLFAPILVAMVWLLSKLIGLRRFAAN